MTRHVTHILSDEPVTVRVGSDEATDGFFRVPNALVHDGHLRQWIFSQAAVYLALACRANAWFVKVSTPTISRDTGLSRRTVQLALKALIDRGFIVDHGPGGGLRSRSFEIVYNGGAPAIRQGQPKDAHSQSTYSSGALSFGGAARCARNSPEVGVNNHRESGAHHTAPAQPVAPQGRNTLRDSKEVQTYSFQTTTPDANGGASRDRKHASAGGGVVVVETSADAMRGLGAIGIGHDAARRLVGEHGAERVGEVLAAADRKRELSGLDNPGGWVRKALRDGWDVAEMASASKASRAARDAERDEHRRRVIAEQSAERERAAAEADEARAHFAGVAERVRALSDDELDAVMDAIAEADDFAARRVRRAVAGGQSPREALTATNFALMAAEMAMGAAGVVRGGGA